MLEDIVAQCHVLIDSMTVEQLTVALAALRRIGQDRGAQGGPLGRLLGVEFTEFTQGRCTCSAEIGEHVWNPHQVAHGAFVYALVDYAMGGAVTSLLTDAGLRPVTLDLQIRYHRPARRGRLSASAHVVWQGEQIVTLAGEVRNESNQIIATATGAYFVKRET
jgi:uncharacterized protein (TIGR00369 family)